MPETFAEKKARLMAEVEAKSKPKIEKPKIDKPKIEKPKIDVSQFATKIDIQNLQSNQNELLTDNQRLNTIIQDYAVKFAQIQQQLANLIINDSKPVVNESYIKTVKDAFDIIYKSNSKHYISNGSTGMLATLNVLKTFFDQL